eukprot:1185389-Prorocentrum_minimum.AAC.2
MIPSTRILTSSSSLTPTCGPTRRKGSARCELKRRGPRLGWSTGREALAAVILCGARRLATRARHGHYKIGR